ncbi:MAG: hypothetical protein P1U69_03180 [Parvibaculaceae bacterium]|nr:hypothetical protein [Parvibaculaceae bacterium]
MHPLVLIGLVGVGYLTFRDLDETLDAATRLTVAATAAGAVYIGGKWLKVI